MSENWEGVGDTSEHRTTGGRAWCFNDAEWCYATSLCQCCDVTRVPDRWKGEYAGAVLADLRAQVEEMYVAAIRYYEASGHSHGMGQMDAFKRVLRLLGGESDGA